MHRGRRSEREGESRILELLKQALGTGKTGMSYRRAGRILAAILLVGLFAVPFAGQISLLVATIVAASVQLVWLLIDGAKEVAPPLRRRSWRVVGIIVLEYSAFLFIVAAALVYFIRALPSFIGD